MSAGRARRLFTDEALRELSRSPRDRLARRLARSDVDGLREEVAALEREHHGQRERYLDWVATILDTAVERHGRAGLRLLVGRTLAFFAAYPGVDPVRDAAPAPMADEVAEAAGRGDADTALAIFDRCEAEWRSAVDVLRDWLSALLSQVYTGYGPDELEAFHRRRGEDALRGLMRDIDRPVGERLENLVRLLQGHFTDLVISEDDEKFTIVQDPCGTCARQVLDGRFAAGLGLAVVTDEHPVTWGGRPTTIYRTHVPIWHVEMARERLGVPWPVNRCPAGLDGGACTILLYKDPHDPSSVTRLPSTASDSAIPATKGPTHP
ncbi:hypothetical protein ACFFX1_18725 [Dactylosporangium sucinum]|uniref:Uncharacterized protein n=1 Tax=Dactylosporangium sucinum TaxID=1424081 RepID=A0A917TZ65_9ACTN|nr:hypothetical protein [Dactylosporangium sucinum]GGM46530.1 hypothetical protein GCM10007977_055330 [Dactylosporangium sucinum]